MPDRGKAQLIGLTGYRYSGKSTVASLLELQGYTQMAVADPLKEIALAIGWDGTKREVPPCDHCGMPQGRLLLQLLGTEGLRANLGQSVWVEALEQRLAAATGPVVVSDVRFPNEAEMIRRRGGTIWRVHRPKSEAMDHATELSIDQVEPHVRIFNNGSLDDLAETVLRTLGELVA